MARKSNKKEVVVAQEVAKEVVVAETTEVAVAKEEVAETTNAKKVDAFISIQEATELYKEAGIICKNPNAKGSYRIMGGGSSLNIKPKKGYYIYTSDADFAEVSSSGIKADDLVIEEGTNAQDHARPNTVICTTLDTLKALLVVYAMNPKNKVPVAKAE